MTSWQETCLQMCSLISYASVLGLYKGVNPWTILPMATACSWSNAPQGSLKWDIFSSSLHLGLTLNLVWSFITRLTSALCSPESILLRLEDVQVPLYQPCQLVKLEGWAAEKISTTKRTISEKAEFCWSTTHRMKPKPEEYHLLLERRKLVRRRRPFSSFYLWVGKEKWSGVYLCTPARNAIAVRPIRLLRIVMCNKVFRARHSHLYRGVISIWKLGGPKKQWQCWWPYAEGCSQWWI